MQYTDLSKESREFVESCMDTEITMKDAIWFCEILSQSDAAFYHDEVTNEVDLDDFFSFMTDIAFNEDKNNDVKVILSEFTVPVASHFKDILQDLCEEMLYDKENKDDDDVG